MAKVAGTEAGLAELLAQPKHGKTYTCGVRTHIDGLESKSDRTAVEAAIDDLRWSANGLSEVLSKRGIRISRNTIAKHRAGDCPCFRKES